MLDKMLRNTQIMQMEKLISFNKSNTGKVRFINQGLEFTQFTKSGSKKLTNSFAFV